MFPNPQDALPLPANPDLKRYESLAKDLLTAAGGPKSAIEPWSTQWVEALVKSSGLTITPGMPVHIKRWARMVAEFAHKQMTSKPEPELADAQSVIARSHGFDSWPTFIKYREALKTNSTESRFEQAADAIVNGDIAALRKLLEDDPNLVNARSTREHGATLLHYVSANGVEGYRQKTPRNIVEITELLLKAGAQVDAECDVYGGGATTLGLAGTSIHPERAGVQAELMQLLLDYGALINRGRSAGNEQDVVNGCLSNDRPAAAKFLAERGANLNLESAAGVGRLEVVKSFFNDDGSLKSNVTRKEMQRGFGWACEYGHRDVVEFLLDKGVSLTEGGQTALHLAAHRGQLEIIKLLLAGGAPLEKKNMYGGTILGQTTWSVMHGDPNIDFVPVIKLLLAEGADVEQADYPTGNERVDALIKRALTMKTNDTDTNHNRQDPSA
jgi:ankyrin repeat protein